MNKTRLITIAAATLMIGSLAACSAGGGSVSGNASPAAATGAAESTQPGSAAAAGFSLVATDSTELGKILTDERGMTLYRFDEDTAKPPKSNCDGECATAWPPAIVTSDDVDLDGVDSTVVGAVTRSDGSKQVTVSGWPLYRYAGDAKPGDTNGQGAGGRWFAATPQGKKALAAAAATPGSGASAGSGAPAGNAAPAAPPAALVVMKVAPLGPIVTDREGMTLYRFDKDTAKPSKSNCAGDCAATWLPVLAGSAADVEVTGVDKALVGTVARSDGSLQVTLAGWPLYRFAKDTKPCDTNGQGVGGVWFAITAQGKKAGV
jgi:predicted lipoprotein with Yx(FWY)xxD motif